jgi:c-di-GMP-binding flagellar brake protein YcgR
MKGLRRTTKVGSRKEHVRKKKEQTPLPPHGRHDARVGEEDKVTVEILGGGGEPSEDRVINALTKDISPGGVRIMTHVRIPAGARLRLEIVLSRRRRLIKVNGVVRWARSIYEDDLFEMGVEFSDLTPEDRVCLLEHIYSRRD